MGQDATWKDCELAARDPDRSIAACSKLLKRPSSPAHAAAFHYRGQAFAAKGNLDKAISDISAAIRLDPERAYRWQERGELYARQGKYQQAIADITEAIRKDPTPRAFRFQHRAEAYQSLGDLTRAIADFDEAIRLVCCADYHCSHSIAIRGDGWSDELRLSLLEPPLVCKACGQAARLWD